MILDRNKGDELSNVKFIKLHTFQRMVMKESVFNVNDCSGVKVNGAKMQLKFCINYL